MIPLPHCQKRVKSSSALRGESNKPTKMAARVVAGALSKGGGVARGTRVTNNGQPGEPGDRGEKKNNGDGPIRAIIESLTSIKEGLKKGEVSGVKSAATIDEVIARVS
jgi:hypothetical protein